MIRDSIFISYSHKDAEYHELFKKMLGGQRLIGEWSDQNIAEGEDWTLKINDAIRGSRIALLLVSPEWVTSKFIQKMELPAILEQRADGLDVWWLYVRAALEPKKLDGIQCVKVRGSADTALEQLTDGDRNAEIKSIVQRMVDSLPRQHALSRNELMEEVQSVVGRFGYHDLDEGPSRAIRTAGLRQSRRAPASAARFRSMFRETATTRSRRSGMLRPSLGSRRSNSR